MADVAPAVKRISLSDRVELPYVEQGDASRETMIGESLKVPAHVWKATLDGLLEAVPLGVSAIATPTLVVWGQGDEVVTREDQERLLAAIPRSRLVVYEAAGHLVHWEEPEQVARDIAAFAVELAE